MWKLDKQNWTWKPMQQFGNKPKEGLHGHTLTPFKNSLYLFGG